MYETAKKRKKKKMKLRWGFGVLLVPGKMSSELLVRAFSAKESRHRLQGRAQTVVESIHLVMQPYLLVRYYFFTIPHASWNPTGKMFPGLYYPK